MAPRSSRGRAISQGDYAMISAALAVAALGFGAWLLWQEQHAELSEAAMGVFHAQMRVIHLFTDRFVLADEQLLAADPARVKFAQLVKLAREIGGFFLVPATLLVLILAALCFRGAARARFRRALDLEGLMREQAAFFRGPAAFAGRRLGLCDMAPGEPRPADPALNVPEWVARFATARDGQFDERAAREELGRQLGPVWGGPRQASPAARCVLAAFALHHAGARAEALAFLGDLSQSVRGGGPEGAAGPDRPLAFPAVLVLKADERLADTAQMALLSTVMARHAYTVPAMMSALLEARRQSGVLPPAEFAFLKLVDRRLWYALHSLGFALEGEGANPHPNPRIEAAGARDHWEAERIAGEPMFLPQLDRAIAAIRSAMKDQAPAPQLTAAGDLDPGGTEAA